MKMVSQRLPQRMLSRRAILKSNPDSLKNGDRIIHFNFDNCNYNSRWFVLTKNHILSYKDEKVYKNPTEVIPISSCCTVKSVDEELNLANTFVRMINCVKLWYDRNLKWREGHSTCRQKVIRRRKHGLEHLEKLWSKHLWWLMTISKINICDLSIYLFVRLI